MENKSEVSLDFIGFNPLYYLGFKQEQKTCRFSISNLSVLDSI